MFSKILIANRGEIAVRIIRTARRLGVKTVVVYSEADKNSLAMEMADEAIAIGGPTAAESYLVQERILQAAKDTGAEAIHPGFGFLSENATFAEAVAQAGLVFVGPTPHAIRAMGDKIESKRLAEKAGVSIAPGFDGALSNLEDGLAVARDIGYPVMIKASAGGGGKGMRIAWDDAGLKEGLASAASEARSSFGDDRVFIEKYIHQGRHIEIQVLGDSHGNVIHLGERECSVQRRHQKVLEEAPSPLVDPEMRARMGAQAVSLAQAVGYRSAGTVEFIVSQDKQFYFLEMNTRLQVEHPVTEMITGFDLVEEMLRVAAGEKLRWTQDDVHIDGWAIEARLYAEDPSRNFLPSIGRLKRYAEPPPSEGVRVDSGVREGDEISMFYDPMIAKLIAHGRNREEATTRLQRALDGFVVQGIGNNLVFLNAALANEKFRSGIFSTAFIEEEFPEGHTGKERTAEVLEVLVPVAAALRARNAEREARISGQMPAQIWRPPTQWVIWIDRTEHGVEVRPGTDGYIVLWKNRSIRVQSDWEPGDGVFYGHIDGHAVTVQVTPTSAGYRLSHAGAYVDAQALTRRAAELAALMPIKQPPDTDKLIMSPMPGLLMRVSVAVGDQVQQGEEIAVVEAMKMENILRAERAGIVKSINAEPGASLAADQVIVEFE
ncbi:MAG TPA: acetyl/propionyl/methylcrotonyl-CoA carboxylase subunit alpha [Alphaproteobacteria bacterium]|nr:acetyl/propionyl/methylcrotonyl-CoA carboxylase subunit alpha [Alphaproteobacteria bacterium]